MTLLCWGSTTQTNIKRLQVIQNRAIRNMTKASRYFRLDNNYLNLRILKVQEIFKLETAQFMHQHFNNRLPTYFSFFFHEISTAHNYRTRNVVRNNYSTVMYRSAVGQRSINYLGPKIWNTLPLGYKNVSKITFKNEYKKILLSHY